MTDDLMGELLPRWLRDAAAAAGAPETTMAGLDAALVERVLQLAGDAARSVVRPAAPLATFALGLSLGGAVLDPADIEERCRRIAEQAERWNGQPPT